MLPSFVSPALQEQNNELHIEALAMEIELLQKRLNKLMTQWGMLDYKKQASRLSVAQKLDAMIMAINGVAKWSLGKFPSSDSPCLMSLTGI